MNLEDRIRASIDRHSPPSGAEVPAGLLRRARRRVALTVAVAVVGVAAVGTGGFVLARELPLDRAPRPGTTVEPTPGPSFQPTPSDPAAPEGPAGFVAGFVAARSSGSGAEEYLSPVAAEHYRSANVLPALYGDESRETRFGESSVDLVRELSDGTHEVLLRLQLIYLGDSPVCPVTERLVVGSGTDDMGQPRDRLILSAELIPRGWERGALSGLAAEEFTCAFVDARLGGSDEDPGSYLDRAAADKYASGEGGLQLHAPEGSHWGFWWIVRWELSGDTVHMVITLNNTGQPDAIYEEFVIGPCCGSFDAERLVLSANRISCQEAGGGEGCP